MVRSENEQELAQLQDDLFCMLAEARSEDDSELAENALRSIFASHHSAAVRALLQEGSLALNRRDWTTVEDLFRWPDGALAMAEMGDDRQGQRRTEERCDDDDDDNDKEVIPKGGRDRGRMDISPTCFYEAQNRLATALFLQGKFQSSKKIAERVLEAEPR